jgi:predicted phosphodiesterase
MKAPRTIMTFGDIHYPYHDEGAVAVFLKALKHIKPDLVVGLGDLLDCGQFSTHPPTYGVPESDYEDDLRLANDFLDKVQRYTKRLVLLEGNHEWRIALWAARTTEGRGAYRLLAPEYRLMAGRKRCCYIPYGGARGDYPHCKINSRIVAVHGWSYAKHATRNHLNISQGMSVIHGHTHRMDVSIIQSLWRSEADIGAYSAGCLCQRVPLYGAGSPVDWVHGFTLGYLGRRSDSIYPIAIKAGRRCILPDGTEIHA